MNPNGVIDATGLVIRDQDGRVRICLDGAHPSGGGMIHMLGDGQTSLRLAVSHSSAHIHATRSDGTDAFILAVHDQRTFITVYNNHDMHAVCRIEVDTANKSLTVWGEYKPWWHSTGHHNTAKDG